MGNDDRDPTVMRKNQHMQIALHEASAQQPGSGNGLARLTFEAQSLPELNLDDVDLRCELLGKALRAPLLIGAMTGGSSEAGAINRVLATAAQRCGVGFCLGSQRPMLTGDPDVTRTFLLRDVAPSTLLIGNIGAIQLRDTLDGPSLQELAAEVGADAMLVHLNPLQEAVQPEGDRDWRGVLDTIAAAAGNCELPLLVKEVGMGLSGSTLRALAATGIAGVETAGVGGTSWSQIEALRHGQRTPAAIAGSVLAGFGTTTARSVVLSRTEFPRRIVIASGGLRDGLEVAKCIALGADAAAMAWPMLVAAQDGVEAVVREVQGVVETLRVAMFLVGAPTLSHLANIPLIEAAQ